MKKRFVAMGVLFLEPIYPEFVKDMKAKGLGGDEVLKFCLDYIRTHP